MFNDSVNILINEFGGCHRINSISRKYELRLLIREQNVMFFINVLHHARSKILCSESLSSMISLKEYLDHQQLLKINVIKQVMVKIIEDKIQ